MTESEWDRLSWDERANLLLKSVYDGTDTHFNYSYGYLNVRLAEGGMSGRPCDSRDLSELVESHIKLRNLKSEYIHALSHLLIGDSTPDRGDLWTFVTATPSERCLAAYKCLEELK